MIDWKLTIAFAATALLAACGPSMNNAPADSTPTAAEPATEPMPAAMEAPALPDLGALLASDRRSAEDRARDAGRKPAEVLEFLGIEPGMAVIDLIAAGGWYTQVLSIAVGEDGSVTAQNPAWMRAFNDGRIVAGLDDRIAAGMGNVRRLDAEWQELGAMESQFDAALSALNVHDVYYMESPEAAAAFAGAVFSALKPGGVFGVIDHVGNADADNGSLHRINKDLIVGIITDAGFVLEDESDILASPGDDHTQGVFAEGIRGKTDRFLLKFRKPG